MKKHGNHKERRPAYVDPVEEARLAKLEHDRRAALPSFRTAAAYAAAVPEAAKYLEYLKRYERVGLYIMQGDGSHGPWEGGYLVAHIDDFGQEWHCHICDCDDGLMIKQVESREAAEAEMEFLVAMAPFNMNELDAFGWRIN